MAMPFAPAACARENRLEIAVPRRHSESRAIRPRQPPPSHHPFAFHTGGRAAVAVTWTAGGQVQRRLAPRTPER